MRRAFLRRVSNRTVDSVLAEPARIQAVLMPSGEDTAVDDDSQIMLIAHEAIDAALGPDAFLASGGTPVGDIVFGAGPARVFHLRDVRRLATKLALATPPEARQARAELDALKHFLMEAARAEGAIVVTVE